ncbi:D-alanyl-D-alanine carboxypeptidase [Candidatus Peregrinibacteria bacterium]|nr:D-alanyl-D-alanine carboxypeptidase [Candidatus Peregrinibacteria bacterium]
MLHALLSLFMLANIQWVAPSVTTSTFDPVNLLQAPVIPVKKNEAVAPLIKAKAALLIDMDSGTALYEKNSHDPLPIASLTKIMTAVIILEAHKPDEIVTIRNNYDTIEGTRAYFRKNEKITVKDMLKAMLVNSANDAAMILAEFHSGSAEQFAVDMNKKARTLNLLNTRFKNPVGFDEDGHYSSAYDLALLTKYALKKDLFRKIVKQPSIDFTDINGNNPHRLFSTNELLGSYLGIEGVKTGTTDAAGPCLINLARNPRNNHEVLAVLLNSPDRFQENKSMIDWAFTNYSW